MSALGERYNIKLMGQVGFLLSTWWTYINCMEKEDARRANLEAQKKRKERRDFAT